MSLEETAICVVDESGRIVKEGRAAREPRALYEALVKSCGKSICRWTALAEAAPRTTQQHLRRHHRRHAATGTDRQRRSDSRHSQPQRPGDRAWQSLDGERVTAHRSHHKIPVFRPAPEGNEPRLNLNKAARLLGVAPKTLRLAAEIGEIEGVHPLPDGPRTFSRSEPRKAACPADRSSRATEPQIPAGSHPDQQSLFLQQHRQMVL